MALFLKQSFILLILFLAVTGCTFFRKNVHPVYSLSINAQKELTANIFLMNENNGNQRFSFVSQISTGQDLQLPKGKYLITTQCSSLELNLTGPTQIPVSTLQLKYHNKEIINEKLNSFVTCNNFTNNLKKTFKNKEIFYMLPGDTRINIAGKKFLVRAPKDKPKQFFIPLFPLKLTSPITNDETIYFLSEKKFTPTGKKIQSDLISSQVNKIIWLPKSKFQIEINGTHLETTISENEMTHIKLSALKLLSPLNFSDENSISLLRSPIFAYLNNLTLLQLDRSYTVFPQTYTIFLGYSQINQVLRVEPGQIYSIQTYGAQIDPPDCIKSENSKCIFSEKVLILEPRTQNILAKVPLGSPILLFNQDYLYSLESTKGVMKNLQKSPNFVAHEKAGELKINWKINISQQKLETQTIEIEPICCAIQGKSKDIYSYKPTKILLPTGQYRFISSIKQEKGTLTKKISLTQIQNNAENSLDIPIYAQSNQLLDILLQDEDTTQSGPTTLIPIAP